MLEQFDDVLSVDEACEALKISKGCLYDLLKSGDLRGFRNGRIWRVPKLAVQEFILKKSGLQKKGL